ncbi:hypothetical protein NDU88_009259 [Pleurodeles waltl]|uniref:Uncharacterized protein n=1 Tax=Pleurodeles waltl TaxID=8319 RepID=A0AAV7QR21_PLEWA|nr:hypothetical protein NDU88_009259 [Pleurodeles waltl]
MGDDVPLDGSPQLSLPSETSLEPRPAELAASRCSDSGGPFRFLSSALLRRLSSLILPHSQVFLHTGESNWPTGTPGSLSWGRGAEFADGELRPVSPHHSSSEEPALRRCRHLGLRRSRGTRVVSSTAARPIQLVSAPFWLGGSPVLGPWFIDQSGLF